MVHHPSLLLVRRCLLRRCQQSPPLLRHLTRSTPQQKPPSSLSQATAAVGAVGSVADGLTSTRLRILLLQRPANAYATVHHRRPYLTQLLTSFTIYILGDLNAQILIGHDTYDPIRTVRMVATGLCLSIPSYHWFKWLGEQFVTRPKGMRIALIVMTNQTAFTPVFLSSFFGLQSVFAGMSFQETKEKLRKVLPVAFLNSCMFWPSVTSISFSFVPAVFRPLFAGVIAVAWNGYLSFVNQRAALQLQQAYAAGKSS